MVVEEALNNGVPVLVSDRVGCAEELTVGSAVGLIFKTDDADDFFNKIRFFRIPIFITSSGKTFLSKTPKPWSRGKSPAT